MMRSLVILPQRNDTELYVSDMEEIAARVRGRAPDIRVTLHWGDTGRVPPPERPGTLALTVALRAIDGDPPPPGRLMACTAIGKLEQYRRYKAHWIPTPPSLPFFWGASPDPKSWGPFAVLKPLDPRRTSAGGALWIPTALVPVLRPEHFGPRHPIHSEPFMLQAFVNTGRYPCHYRVLVLLGEPIYAMRITLKVPRPPVGSSIADILSANIASNGGPRERVMIAGKDILDFARQASCALPDVPLQGVDILKEHKTGRLFAIESNPGGNTWHLSSKFGAHMREEMGDGRRILLDQFGALDRAADALIRATRSHARA